MSEDNKNQEMLTKIYREVGETKTSVYNLNKRLEDHINLTLTELKAINELDNEQNRILDVHIAGVRNLEKLYTAHRKEGLEQLAILKELLQNHKAEMNARIEALEKPYDLIKYAGKVIMWVGGVSGAVYGIARLFGAL